MCFRWYDPRSGSPRHAVEAWIQWLYDQQWAGREGRSDIVGAEWWAHRRGSSHVGHRLHWDTDESISETQKSNNCSRFPVESSVLFLSDGGGATVVLDQRLGEGLGHDAWAVAPREGRFMAFNGNSLHGVMPWCGEFCSPRLTLMVGWWSHVIQPPEGAQLGPCMRLPRGDLPQWTTQFGTWDSSWELEGAFKTTTDPDLCVSPAWVAVNSKTCDDDVESTIMSEAEGEVQLTMVSDSVNQNYFLREQSDLEREY